MAELDKYFKTVKTIYHTFVNKQWAENSRRCASKREFVDKINILWKENYKNDPIKLKNYLTTPFTPYKPKYIEIFFIKQNKKSNSVTKPSNSTTTITNSFKPMSSKIPKPSKPSSPHEIDFTVTSPVPADANNVLPLTPKHTEKARHYALFHRRAKRPKMNRLLEAMRQFEESSDSDEESDSEIEVCALENCKIVQYSADDIDRVACDSCKNWAHQFCLGRIFEEEEKYTCYKCANACPADSEKHEKHFMYTS